MIFQKVQSAAAERVQFRPSPPTMISGIRFFPSTGSFNVATTMAIEAGGVRLCEPVSIALLGDPLNEVVASDGPREFMFPAPVSASDASPLIVEVASASTDRYTIMIVEQ